MSQLSSLLIFMVRPCVFSLEGKPSQRVTPESLVRRNEGGDRPWLWVVVALLAAAVGVAVGLLTSGK